MISPEKTSIWVKDGKDSMKVYITQITIDQIDCTNYDGSIKLVQGYMVIHYIVIRGAIQIDCSVKIPSDMNLTLQQLTDKVASMHGGVTIANY